jgi:hypothetical protein
MSVTAEDVKGDNKQNGIVHQHNGGLPTGKANQKLGWSLFTRDGRMNMVLMKHGLSTATRFLDYVLDGGLDMVFC